MDARDKLGIPWQHAENEKHGMFLMAFENQAGLPVEPATFQLYAPALSALWGDSGIREAYSRRSEFQLVSGPSWPWAASRGWFRPWAGCPWRLCGSTGKPEVTLCPKTQQQKYRVKQAMGGGGRER